MEKIYKMIVLCFTILFAFIVTSCGNESNLKEAKLVNQNGEPVTVFPSDKPSLIFLFTTAG